MTFSITFELPSRDHRLALILQQVSSSFARSGAGVAIALLVDDNQTLVVVAWSKRGQDTATRPVSFLAALRGLS